MPDLEDILRAASLLENRIIRTPLVYSPTFSVMTGAEVWLKTENLQKAGSFKIRGAMNRIISERERIGPAGVVAASAGNHAQGVALAAREAGVPATIIMPEWASISKQEATRAYGASVLLSGQSLGDALKVAEKHSLEEGMVLIHPYDDELVIAGQGTIAIEILEDLPDTDRIVVPVGGGGLISGITVAAKALRPQIRITGVQAAACPSALEALERGGPVRVSAEPSLADGIRVTQTGAHTFPLIRDLVDEIVTVGEAEIADAILALLERKRLLAEGAGAVPLAALSSGKIPVLPGEKVVLVISGGNVDTPLLGRIIRHGLFRRGRIMQFSASLPDRPGSLASLLGVMAGCGGNVLRITHSRGGSELPLELFRVDIEVETRGPRHIEEIAAALKEAGYPLLKNCSWV